jgi:hypothetical protein
LSNNIAKSTPWYDPSNLNSGSIPIADGNTFIEDYPNLYYDVLNHRFGINVGSSPCCPLDVSDRIHIQTGGLTPTDGMRIKPTDKGLDVLGGAHGPEIGGFLIGGASKVSAIAAGMFVLQNPTDAFFSAPQLTFTNETATPGFGASLIFDPVNNVFVSTNVLNCLFSATNVSMGTMGTGTAAALTERLTVQGNINLYNDNDQILFGRGKTETIESNGNDLLLNGSRYIGLHKNSPTSKIHSGGSEAKALVTLGASTTLNDTNYTVLINSTLGSIVVALPSALTCTGRIYVLKRIDSSVNSININPFGSETIDGSTLYPLPNQYDAITIQSDGTNWSIIGKV